MKFSTVLCVDLHAKLGLLSFSFLLGTLMAHAVILSLMVLTVVILSR